MANTAKNVSELKTASVEQLSKDVAALKSDIANIAGTLRDFGQESASVAAIETKKRAAALKEDALGKVDSLQTTADQLAVQAKETVQERPATALLVAAAVGMAFGLMTARR